MHDSDSPTTFREPKWLADNFVFSRMRDVEQWLIWGLQRRDGKLSKIPIDQYGNVSGSTATEDYFSYERARQVDAEMLGVMGPAFCFVPGDGFVGIDLDDCLECPDDTTEVFSEWAIPILERFAGAHIEVSPSLTGVKIFAIGQKPEGFSSQAAVENGAIEVYEHGRFFTVTRMSVREYPPSAEEQNHQEAIDWLCDEYLAKKDQLATMSAASLQGSQTWNRKRIEDYIDAVPGKKDGHRNNAGFQLAGKLVANGLSDGDLKSAVLKWNDKNSPPMSEEEVIKFIGNAKTKGTLPPPSENKEFSNHSEEQLATARQVANLFGESASAEIAAASAAATGTAPAATGTESPEETTGTASSDPPWGPTDGNEPPDSLFTQSPDEEPKQGKIEFKQVDTATEAREFQLRHSEVEGNELVQKMWFHHGEWWEFSHGTYQAKSKELVKSKAMADFAEKYRDVESGRTGSVLGIAMGRMMLEGEAPRWVADGNNWDVEDCIVFKNVIVNRKTRETQPNTGRFFSKTCSPVEYDPNAPVPQNWLNFLYSVWGDDPESIEKLQEMMGLLLTTDTSHHAIFFLQGPPRSGKGTILDILQAIVGGDSTAALDLGRMANQFITATLMGKSLCTFSDARFDGRGMSTIIESLLSISGEDTIACEKKGKDAVSTKLKSRIVICSNVIPDLQDESDAIVDRFVPFRMTRTFRGVEDLGLKNRLIAELPGIVNWAFQGLSRLDQSGERIAPPKSGESILTTMRENVSNVSMWMEECCELGDNCRCTRGEVMASYKQWCDRNFEKPISNKKVFEYLRGKGIQDARVQNDRCFRGMVIRQPWTTISANFTVDKSELAPTASSFSKDPVPRTADGEIDFSKIPHPYEGPNGENLGYHEC